MVAGKVNSYALSLVGAFESCRLKAYQDQGGKWTIGWGETNGVEEGMIWTQQEADAKRDARLEVLDGVVRRKWPGLTGQQVGALVSFEYNTGRLFGTTVGALIDRGDPIAAAKELVMWDMIHLQNGKVVNDRGLLRRRLAEAAMFVQGMK